MLFSERYNLLNELEVNNCINTNEDGNIVINEDKAIGLIGIDGLRLVKELYGVVAVE